MTTTMTYRVWIGRTLFDDERGRVIIHPGMVFAIKTNTKLKKTLVIVDTDPTPTRYPKALLSTILRSSADATEQEAMPLKKKLAQNTPVNKKKGEPQ